MKAIIWTRYGAADGLQLQEIDKPVPGENEILVKVRATSVTAGDSEMRRLKLPLFLSFPMRLFVGFFRPKRVRILGQEMSGEVEAVGSGVTRYKPGDEVFGTTGLFTGTYAEYILLPETPTDMSGTITHKPANLSHEEAAVVPTAALEALHFLRKANLKPGDKVLINGAGGSIGTFGIQIARQFGAEVTAVDRTEKLEMLRQLGADQVIDYTKEDFTRAGEKYRAILDVVGQAPFTRALRSLKENGYFLIANPNPRMVIQRLLFASQGRQVVLQAAKQTPEDLNTLKEMLEEGSLKAVIDRSFPLEETAAAHKYVDSGQKQGNVVIKVS